MVFCPTPATAVGLPAGGFWIDRFEVTVRDYREFLAATGRSMPEGARLWSDPVVGSAFLPATGMRLAEARAFAERRGKRLPTAAEWDWAARGPAQFRYPWGDRFDEAYANTADLDLRRPTTVGTFYNGRSQFSGAYDLVGNVWEWTDSRVSETLEQRFRIRGGSFLTRGVDAMDAPSGARQSEQPQDWANDLGFRCVADRDAIERDLGFREALAKVGARDPLRVVFELPGAMEALRAANARPLVAAALAVNEDPVVRKRLESLAGSSSGAGRR